MKCFEQKKNFTTVYFKDIHGNKISVYLDWDSYDGKKQILFIDVWDIEKGLQNDNSGNLFWKDVTIAKGEL
jgi:catechol-2,3-dioxygenase